MPVTFPRPVTLAATATWRRPGRVPCARRSIRARTGAAAPERHAPARGRLPAVRPSSMRAIACARALDGIEASGIAPDGVVFTGDLADLGEGDAYSDLRALVEPFAERLGTRVFWVMGNHDDRAAVPRPPARRARRRATRCPVDRVDELDGLRLVTLDSSVPGLPPRRSCANRQLAWLAGRLADPGAARHDPRDAPPAGAERARPRRERRAARPVAPRAQCCAAPTCARSSPGTCTTRRSPRSRASPSRSRRRPATRRT